MSSIWREKHLISGVLAQFFYVGAQVGVTSFVIRFVQHALPGTPEKSRVELSQMASARIHDRAICGFGDDEEHRAE